MPYNVICLSCTVVALAFGPLYNITTKQLVLRSTASRGGIIKYFKNKLGCFKKDKSGDEVSEQQSEHEHAE